MTAAVADFWLAGEDTWGSGSVPAAYLDSSGGGHDGTPIDHTAGSSVLTCRDGQADGGKAIVQQGASGLVPRISLPPGAWAQLQTFTVEFIVKPTNTPNNQMWMHEKEVGTHGWTIILSSGNLGFDAVGSPAGSVGTAFPIPAGNFTDGVFHQYVLGFRANPQVFEHHRDGSHITTTGSGMNHTITYPASCDIGLFGDVAGFGGVTAFHGWADEVAIFPGLLSTARVAAHWTALQAGTGFEAAVMADTPVGYWRFEECGALLDWQVGSVAF